MNKKLIVVFSLISIVSFLLLSKNESYSISNIKKMNSNIEELPAKYDLRNVGGKNYAPSIKNQENLGLCWDFATVSAMESSIVKSGLVDSNEDISLSTRYFDFATSYSLDIDNPYGWRKLTTGGSLRGLESLLISGMGPVEKKYVDDGIYGTWEGYNEDFTEQETLPIKSVLNNDLSTYTVTDTISFQMLNIDSTVEEREQLKIDIKKHLMDYGALYIETLEPAGAGKCLIWNIAEEPNTFFIDYTEEDCDNRYHAMTLIGWDDNFEYSYCNSYFEVPKDYELSPGDSFEPDADYEFDENKCLEDGNEWVTRKGAWIIQNSWGNDLTYGHMSYESTRFLVSGIKGIIKKDWNNNYNTITSYFEKKPIDDGIVYKFSKVDDLEESVIRLSLQKDYCENNVDVYLNTNCTNGCNEEDYRYIGTVDKNDGIESLEINNIVIDNDYFSVKVLDDCINNVGVYTNKNQSVIPFAKIVFDDSNRFTTSVNLVTNYLESGTKITYKLYDKNLEIGSFDGYIINNVSKTDFKLSSFLKKGQYTLVAYQGDNEIASAQINYDGKGFGTEENPFLISNREDLQTICDSKDLRKANYKLESDLYLSEWKSICGEGEEFQGTIDGDGHTIYDFSVSDSSSKLSLIEQTEGATIKNIIFRNIEVDSDNLDGGTIVTMANDTTFDQIAIFGKHNGWRTYSGLVYFAFNSKIKNVYIDFEYSEISLDDLNVFVNVPLGTNIDDSYATARFNVMLEENNRSFIVDDNQSYYYTLDELKNKETYITYGFDFDNVWQIEDGSLASLKIMTNKFDINENSDYEILDEKFITQISLNTKLSDYLNNFDYSNEYSVVVTKGNNILSNNDLISTGSITNIYKNNKLIKSYVNIVLGDITGNGKSTISDVAKLYQFYKNKITMDECFIKAGDVVNNKKIGINDIAKLYQFVKGKINKL